MLNPNDLRGTDPEEAEGLHRSVQFDAIMGKMVQKVLLLASRGNPAARFGAT
jgi:hypothetical protein